MGIISGHLKNKILCERFIAYNTPPTSVTIQLHCMGLFHYRLYCFKAFIYKFLSLVQTPSRYQIYILFKILHIFSAACYCLVFHMISTKLKLFILTFPNAFLLHSSEKAVGKDTSRYAHAK